MARGFETVGVVGLGTMGAGIAEVLARNGLKVYGVELDEGALERGRGHVESSTRRAVAKGKLAEPDAAALLGRITFTSSLADLAEADLVIEAIPERLELKRGLFQQLDSICRAEAIFATNTSSLSVTEISVATSRPGRVVGIHFFNPAPVMRLVEVVRTVVTEPEVLADVEALAARLGKSPVVIGDKAGFIANALLFGYLNHAATMFEARYASREDIDAAMRYGCRLPDGPARAARPDRSRHGVRDPRHHVQAGPRPAARAYPDPQADEDGRAAPGARPRTRLLHLPERPGAPPRSSRTS